MNSKDIPELTFLKRKVEEKFGRKANTTYGFEALSVVIEHETGELISASTLKRLWGYVSSNPIPRISTLDILARYVEESDFASFCRKLKESGDVQSGYETGSVLTSSDLKEGAVIMLQWNPNRLVRLRYLGDKKFTVIESVNSKLREGDVFEIGCFILGYPMYIPEIQRDGEKTAPYIAGSRDGLTKIRIDDERGK